MELDETIRNDNHLIIEKLIMIEKILDSIDNGVCVISQRFQHLTDIDNNNLLMDHTDLEEKEFNGVSAEVEHCCSTCLPYFFTVSKRRVY